MTEPLDLTALALLRDAESYLSALHGSVARHDVLAANLGCAGCELRDRIAAALPTLKDAASSAAQPPADQAALRDRIAQALANEDARAWGYDHDFVDRYGADAETDGFVDAVVAVLPEPADRAAVYAEVADRLAADAEQDAKDGLTRIYRRSAAKQVSDWGKELRRMADETQPTQAYPPHHRWRVEFHDPVADEWIPGARFLNRHHAVERYQDATEKAPTWKDGTPVQRRLVRETTTYTVEDPGARQDGARP